MKLGRIAVIAVIIAGVYFVIMNNQSMFLAAADGVKIAYDFYDSPAPKGWLILAHMMPATKESWSDFAKELQSFGYASLAVDLRGHGQSDGGPDGYQKFSDLEHQAGIKDLEAAWEFLKSRGAVPEKTFVIGASIGANLSLRFLIEHPDINGGVFLSPGNYKGLDSGVLVKKLLPKQKILLVASKQDDRSAGNAKLNQEYYRLAAAQNKHLIIFDGAGHGTDLFKLRDELDLISAIKKFLEHGSIQ